MEEKKLEAYLQRLNMAMGKISVGEKAEIITEIKSHIIEAKENDPDASLEKVLASFGEPEIVANRYLRERGLKPVSAPRYPILKWVTIGFLGTGALFLLSLVLLIWKFTPLIDVNEEKGKVALLGGLISIDKSEESVKFGDTTFKGKAESFEGKVDLQGDDIEIEFGTGTYKVYPYFDKEVKWKCKVADAKKIKIEQTPSLKMNFKDTDGSICKISIPPGVNVKLKGQTGHVQIDKPKYNLDLELQTGNVTIYLDDEVPYEFDVQIQTGKAPTGLVNSMDPEAFKIKASVQTGLIEID